MIFPSSQYEEPPKLLGEVRTSRDDPLYNSVFNSINSLMVQNRSTLIEDEDEDEDDDILSTSVSNNEFELQQENNQPIIQEISQEIYNSVHNQEIESESSAEEIPMKSSILKNDENSENINYENEIEDQGKIDFMITVLDTPVSFEVKKKVVLAPLVFEKTLSDEELSEEFEKLIETKIIPEEQIRGQLLVYVKKELVNSIMNQDYDSAERYKEGEKLLSKNPKVETHRAANIIPITTRIQCLKDKIESYKEEWEDKFQEFLDNKKEKQEELLEKQQHEVEDFQTKWESRETMLQFNKPSAQLLQIRKIQMSAAFENDFQRAKELKKHGDELEKIETAKAEKIALSAMKRAYHNLQIKHEREVVCANQNWARQQKNLENERDKKLNQYNTQLKALQYKKENERKEAIHTIMRPKCPSKNENPVLTPRSRNNLKEYKSNNNAGTLNLNPLKVPKCHRIRKQNRRRSETESELCEF